MAMAVTTVVTTVDTTEDIIPTTPVMDTVVEVTMVVVATMEVIILRPTTVMATWIADIPTDIQLGPESPQVVQKHQLPVIPGTEAALLHQQNQQLPHVPHAPAQV